MSSQQCISPSEVSGSSSSNVDAGLDGFGSCFPLSLKASGSNSEQNEQENVSRQRLMG